MRIRPLFFIKIIALIIILLSAGCSRIKFGYNYLDWYLMNKFNAYFDLNDMQEVFLKKGIRDFHSWHRKNELPKYTDYLSNIKTSLEKGLERKELDEFYIRFDEFKDRFMAQLIPLTSGLLAKMDKEQIDDLEKEFLKRNKKIEDLLNRPPEKSKKERIESFKGRIEDWIGTVNKDQLKMIKELIETTPDYNVYSLPHRIKIQKAFFNNIRNMNTIASNQPLLTDIWINSYKDVNSDYSIQWNFHREQNKLFLLKLYSSLTEKQKAFLLKRFENMIVDIKELYNT